MMTFEAIRAMSNAEIKERIREVSAILDCGCFADGWGDAYKEYCRLNDVLDERYRNDNQAEFDAFYAEHIEGKAWEDIDPEAWQFYSDWHKDMYGFRPKHI